MTASRHAVRRAADATWAPPAGAWAAGTDGFTRWVVVGEPDAVHTGFAICSLAPGGSVPTHVHAYEECLYVTEGAVILQTAEGAARLAAGDYALIPLGQPHGWRNEGPVPVRWADLMSPQPRDRYAGDSYAVPEIPATTPVDIDVRDPRNRNYGRISAAHMAVDQQGQQHLALSASMRTALLVYSGITVKMMVDSDLGAELTTMFMVQYDPDGVAGAHDHPFEETYLFLEGTAEAVFDGTPYRLEAGDVAFAGVGCVHGFRNLGGGPLRWLETQAPQPPGRHSYRFVRDWDYLATRLQEGST